MIEKELLLLDVFCLSSYHLAEPSAGQILCDPASVLVVGQAYIQLLPARDEGTFPLGIVCTLISRTVWQSLALALPRSE